MRIVVIGSGPGGYSAAIRSSQLGAEVFLIEKEYLGGICLNKGCIPSKVLLHVAQTYESFKKTKGFGISLDSPPRCDFKKVIEHKNKIVERLRIGMESQLKKQGTHFVNGIAKIATPNLIYVDTSNGGPEIIETDKIIIASGSEDLTLPVINLAEERILTATEVFNLSEIPENVIILGAGPVGVEFACLFNALGAEVSLIELLPQVLPQEDAELARAFQRVLELRGIRVFNGTRVERVDCGPECVTAHLSSEINIVGGVLISCIGRKPHLTGLGLENVDVLIEREAILVNEMMETTAPGIYAVGDVVGKAMVAHIASVEGLVAAENASGEGKAVDYSVIPSCVYSFPEIASVGIAKEKAEELGYKVKVAKSSFLTSGKAHILGETNGFIQIIVDKETHKILGCQIMGYGATEIIHEAALAIRLGATAKDLANLIHAHPTFSESYMEAARNIYGKGIYS
ncbi:MAG: dihydrolipoyl dehydrogenase [Candidatus Subteraquimicrobiales bacterium]|nr:dihydrolipoyl dehydrogenase [Candidatus Subteraquimicrobiales bacterium]